MRSNRFSRFLSAVLGVPRGGAIERERTIVLEGRRHGEHAPVGPGLDSAEQAVLIQVDQTLALQDRRLAGRLLKGQQRLVRAARRNLIAWDRLQAAQHDPRWLGHDRAAAGGAAAPDEPPGPRSRLGRLLDGRAKTFREDFDPHQPLLSGRTLGVIEFVFLVVEFFFWYAVFGADIDRRAALLAPERISAVLLALFLPVAGLLAARVVGALGHRWVLDYAGIGRRERLGTLLAAVIAVGAVGATVMLVQARFDASHTALGALPVPAWPMAIIFGSVLLADIAARIFMPSEIRHQSVRRARTLHRMTRAAIERNAAHVQAWLALRTEVQVQLDRCERIVAVGATLITDARAGDPRAADQLGHRLVEFGPGRSAHRPVEAGRSATGRAVSPLAVPDSAQLHLFGVALALGPIRCVEDAIDTLDHWRPKDHDGIGDDVERLRDTLFGVERRAARPAPAAPAGIPAQHGPPDRELSVPMHPLGGADKVNNHHGAGGAAT